MNFSFSCKAFHVKLFMKKLNQIKDNSSKALEFYEKNKIERIEWPAKSKDLNPIENMDHC